MQTSLFLRLGDKIYQSTSDNFADIVKINNLEQTFNLLVSQNSPDVDGGFMIITKDEIMIEGASDLAVPVPKVAKQARQLTTTILQTQYPHHKIKLGKVFTCDKGTIPLEKLRQEIDKLDRELVDLLARRFRTTYMVGRYKAINGLPAVDTSREQAQFAKLQQLAHEVGLDETIIKTVARLVIDLVVERHEKMK